MTSETKPNVRQLLGWTTVPRPPKAEPRMYVFAIVPPIFAIITVIGTWGSDEDPVLRVAVPAFFLFMGALGWAHVIITRRRDKRIALARAAAPTQPWTWDFEWDPAGFSDRSSGSWQIWLFLLLFTIALAFTMQVVGPPDSNLRYVTAVLYLFCGAVAVFLAYRFARRRKYGKLRVSYTRFPFFTSEQVDLRLTMPPVLASASSLKAILRCVQEAANTSGNTQGQMAFEVYRDEVVYDIDAVRAFATTELPIRFDIPPDAPETLLDDVEPRYWDLEVRAEARGIDYVGHFLVPIYHRHGDTHDT